MILTKLILAHIIGDFFLQSEKWVESKREKKWRSPYLYFHIIIHFALIILLFWDLSMWNIALIIAGSHWAIDVIKLQFQTEKTVAIWFTLDQAAHIGVIVYAWDYFWGNGLVFPFQESFWIIITGLLFITYPASFSIQRLMYRWSDEIEIENEGSLKGAGEYIGILERLMIFTAIVGGYPQVIGFLLAAKSVFRFGDLTRSKDRKLTEYILAGTLFSFLIAIATGLAVVYFLNG